jgi:hypothetical protein
MSWKYVYTSVPGSSHLVNDIPCQDASLLRLWQGPESQEIVLIAIAADGAGSATHSKMGSRFACRILLKIIEAWLCQNDLEQASQGTVLAWLIQTRNVLIKLAEHKGIKIRDLASTLLFTVASSQHTLFAQIGDGAIVYRNTDKYEVAFWPQTGEYQNTTYFVTDESSFDKLQYAFLALDITELALFTDGLQMLALEQAEKRPYPPFFMPLFSQLHQQEQTGHLTTLTAPLRHFLNSEKVNRRTDDDKTLILATKR